ncbi:MAG TPA: polyphenol oxidase family protein [Thermoanaerobaculia bacterium]|nr:polyphenol oxidase family protein [Thermoanaerobaculia bacterium]
MQRPADMTNDQRSTINDQRRHTWPTEITPELGRIVQAPDVPPGFGLFYTTVDFSGRLAGEDLDALTAHLERRWGAGIGLVTCTQVHGADAVFAQDPPDGWREVGRCDAIWSDRPNVAIGIKVADCLPVTIIDPAHGVLANIHSGWRGAAEAIVGSTLEAMKRLSRFSLETARVWLGPSIRSCCFEVGEEVVAAMSARYGDVTDCLAPGREDRPHFDLARLTGRILTGAGLPAGSLYDSGICTRCEGSIFHSWRRDRAAAGRVLAVAVQA